MCLQLSLGHMVSRSTMVDVSLWLWPNAWACLAGDSIACSASQTCSAGDLVACSALQTCSAEDLVVLVCGAKKESSWACSGYPVFGPPIAYHEPLCDHLWSRRGFSLRSRIFHGLAWGLQSFVCTSGGWSLMVPRVRREPICFNVELLFSRAILQVDTSSFLVHASPLRSASLGSLLIRGGPSSSDLVGMGR